MNLPSWLHRPSDDDASRLPESALTELRRLETDAIAEAIRLGASEPDPTRWDGGEVSFELERSLAHAHHAVREGLRGRIDDDLGEVRRELAELAGEVATVRADLAEVDAQLVTTVEQRQRLEVELAADPVVHARALRRRSPVHRAGQAALYGLLVAAELSVSGTVFDAVVAVDIPFIGFVLALGLMVVLVGAPHVVATQLRQHVVPARAVRRAEAWTGTAVAVGLTVLVAWMIPSLSELRAREVLVQDGPWITFFVLLQATICVFVFLHAWVSMDAVADRFAAVSAAEAELARRRSGLLDELGEAVGAYLDEAEDVATLSLRGLRWEAAVRSRYLATVHRFRHELSVACPDLAPFVTLATIPALPADEASGIPARSTDPTALLAEHLRTLHGLDLTYVPPAALGDLDARRPRAREVVGTALVPAGAP